MSANINFYDASLRHRRDWLTVETLAISCAVSLLLAVSGIAASQRQLSQLQAEAQSSTQQVQVQQAAMVELARNTGAARPDPRLQAQVQLAQASWQQRQTALDLLQRGAIGSEQGHAATLAALARQAIDGLWITGLTLDSHQVALRGRALDPQLIPNYLLRLNREPALEGQSFGALQLERPAAAAAPLTPGAANGAVSADAATIAGTEPSKAAFVEFSLVGAQGAEAPATRSGALR